MDVTQLKIGKMYWIKSKDIAIKLSYCGPAKIISLIQERRKRYEEMLLGPKACVQSFSSKEEKETMSCYIVVTLPTKVKLSLAGSAHEVRSIAVSPEEIKYEMNT